jgi:hypothetical protein
MAGRTSAIALRGFPVEFPLQLVGQHRQVLGHLRE